jgi:hypothetical protein
MSTPWPKLATAVCFEDSSDPVMFVFDKQIPAGKSVLALEHAWGVRELIRAGSADAGDYNHLDSFVSLHGLDIENEIKAYAKHARLDFITGTFTDGKGKEHNKVEFLVVDDDEYRALYEHIAEFVAKKEAEDSKELLLAQERTKQEASIAAQATANAEMSRHQLIKDMLQSDASTFWELMRHQLRQGM